MVTDAGVEHFGSMRASVPYIWTALRHVLKGLTPTCVNKNLDKFLALLRPLRASSGFADVFARHIDSPHTLLLKHGKKLRVEVTTDNKMFSKSDTCSWFGSERNFQITEESLSHSIYNTVHNKKKARAETFNPITINSDLFPDQVKHDNQGLKKERLLAVMVNYSGL